MKRVRALWGLPLLVLAMLMFEAPRTGTALGALNLCALSTVRDLRRISPTATSSMGCPFEPRDDTGARWNRLIGRRALQSGQYKYGVTVLQRSAQLQPDDMLTHFWLAQLYDRSAEAAQAMQEYTWLIDRLPQDRGDSPSIEWLRLQVERNRNLDLLLSGQKLVDGGSLAEGIEILRKLNTIEPHNTLAQYYLYRAYVQSGSNALADNLLPELAFITYGPDERWHQLLNDAIPELAIPLMRMSYWDDIQVANVASLLAWRGDLVNASGLLDLANEFWRDDGLLASVTSDLRQRKEGIGRSCLTCAPDGLVDSSSGCAPVSINAGVEASQFLHDSVRTQLGAGPTSVRLGPNLLKNGSFERQDQGFPESWFFARSVALDAATDKWETASDFSPSAGVDSIALCDGSHSARLQVIWDRSQGDGLFAAISQQVSLTEPGIYALGICYLVPHGVLVLSVAQDGQVLWETRLPASAHPCSYDARIFRVEHVGQPLYVSAKLYGAGWAWVDNVLLQRVENH